MRNLKSLALLAGILAINTAAHAQPLLGGVDMADVGIEANNLVAVVTVGLGLFAVGFGARYIIRTVRGMAK